MGLVIVELQDLETHLNLIKDLTGSWVRMSNTTSYGRRLDDNNFGFLLGWDIGDHKLNFSGNEMSKGYSSKKKEKKEMSKGFKVGSGPNQSCLGSIFNYFRVSLVHDNRFYNVIIILKE